MPLDKNYPAVVQVIHNGEPVSTLNPFPVTGGTGGGSSVSIEDENGDPIEDSNPFPVAVLNDVSVTQSGVWTVSVDNFPATVTVNQGTSPWTVDGTVNVGNFPAVQPVSDNGGSLTVDGTVAATQSGAWSVRITDGTDTADVLDLANANPLTVALVDASGDQITSFGGGVQYAEGDTDATPMGTLAMWWDNGSGDVVATSPANPLPVTVGGTVTVTGTVAATQSGAWTVDQGTSPWVVDGSGFTQPVSDAGGSLTVDGTVTANQGGTWTVEQGSPPWSVQTEVQADFDTTGATQDLSLIGVALPSAAGAVIGGTAANPIRINPTGTTAQPVTDNGGSLTVDGTVAATQSGTWTVDQGTSPWVVDGSGVTQPVSDAGGSLTVDDGGTTLSVDDGGGSLTVDGAVTANQGGAWTVAATQSGAWAVRVTDGTDTADVFDLANSNPVAVALVDASGDQITSFGGGVQYTEGDTDATPTGTVAMWWDDGTDALHAASPSNPLPVEFTNTTIAVTDGGGSLTVDGTVAVSGVAATVTVSPEHADGAPFDGFAMPVGGVDVNGNFHVAATAVGGILQVTHVDEITTDVINSLNDSALVITAHRSGVGVVISGTWSGTISFSGAVNGSSDQACEAYSFASSSWVGSTTTNGRFWIPCGGFVFVTLTATAWTSGTANIELEASIGQNAAIAQRVSDGGDSLTVDGTVAATQSGAWSVRITDGTDTADVFDLANSNPLSVAIVDGSGDQVTSFGGGTEYAEDSAHSSGAMGHLPLTVRNDDASASYLAGSNGDYQALQSDNQGNLKVTVSDLVSSDSITAIGQTVSAASFLSASTSLSGKASLIVTVSGTFTGTLTFVGVTADGTSYALVGTNLQTGGRALATTTTGSWRFDCAGYADVALVSTAWTSGTADIVFLASAAPISLDIRQLEDAAHASGDVGVMSLAVRRDADTTLVSTSGDYAPLQVNSVGFLKVTTPDSTQSSIISAGSVVRQFILNGISTLVVEINGTMSTGTLAFSVVGAGGVDQPIKGRRQSNGQVVSSITGTDTEIVVFNVAGYTEFWVTSSTWGGGDSVNLFVRFCEPPNGVNVYEMVPGIGATNLGKAEDDAHNSGDVGVMALAVVQQAPAAATAADGDYTRLNVDRLGNLRVHASRYADRLTSGSYSVSTFRTLGNAAAAQNLFTIENANGSNVLIAVREIQVYATYTAVLTAFESHVQLSRSTALPTNGTTLTQALMDTANSASGSVTCRGATASDGGGATAITATAGTIINQGFIGRIHTAVGEQQTKIPVQLWPMSQQEAEPLIIRANAGLLVQVVNATAASNAATNHYIVVCRFEVCTSP